MTATELATTRRRDWPGWALAALLLAVGVFGVVLPDMGYFSKVPGDIGDPRFNSVILEHLYRLVTGTQHSLWDPDFHYPFTGVLAFSDNHLGSGATYVLARLAGLSREHAFDVWYLAGYIVNFGACLYALRRFGFPAGAAAIGAFVFSFALPVLAQHGHAQLVYRFGVPLAALALWEAFRDRQPARLAGVLFWTAWQFYCALYTGIFLGYLLAAMTAVLVLTQRPLDWQAWLAGWRAETRARQAGAIVLGLLSLVAVGYLLGNYLHVSRLYHLSRPIEELTSMMPRWASYFTTDAVPMLRLLTSKLDIPVRGEQQMFVGFAVLALVVIGAVVAFRRDRSSPSLGKAMFWSLLVLIVGTLWIRHFSFYYLIAWLPGVNSLRAIARVIVIMMFPMAVLAALATRYIGEELVRSRRLALAALAVLGLLVAMEPLSVRTGSDTIALWRERVAAVRALLPAELPPDAILWVRSEGPQVVDFIHINLDAMILGQELNLPTLNGYSGYGPPGYGITDSNSCRSVDQMLEPYARFSGGDVSELKRRVVVLDLAPCQERIE